MRWQITHADCPICQRPNAYLTFQNPDSLEAAFEKYYEHRALDELHTDFDEWAEKLC